MKSKQTIEDKINEIAACIAYCNQRMYEEFQLDNMKEVAEYYNLIYRYAEEKELLEWVLI